MHCLLPKDRETADGFVFLTFILHHYVSVCMALLKHCMPLLEHLCCAGATTAALTLTGDLGLPWDAAVEALQETADLAQQHGEQASPHK